MTTYDPSRRIIDSNVAGFSHWNGFTVLGKLRPGSKLRLKAEFDNPYDPNAVAVYYKKTKIGFVPRRQNYLVAQLIRFGHKDVLEAYVTNVDLQATPEQQVWMTIMVRDRR